jgi:chromosome segregation ATPase
MKARDTQLKARLFELEQKRRQIADLGTMVNDFRRMAADLDHQIETEHQRTGIRDLSHFAYSSFAKAARQRRDNLLNSVNDLVAKIEAAQADLGRLEANLKTLAEPDEPVEERSRFSRRPSVRQRVHSAPKSGV